MAIAALSASEASAQMYINAGMGAAVPIGSSADLLNVGYSAMLSVDTKPNWMRGHLRLEGAVNSLVHRVAGSPKREVLSVTVNLITDGGTRDVPSGYAVIGAGYYQQSGSIARRTDPGINVGAGIRFPVGFFATFIEARLHYVADDAKTKYFPMTFGLVF
ncbi:MAG: hypothetical protein AABZ80_04790 [Gemmatimonadota bacterium]